MEGRFMYEMGRGSEKPPPPPKGREIFPAEFESTVDFLIACLRSFADEQGIASGILANRADVSAVVLSGSRADVPLLEGWRREAVGDLILAVLQGKVRARIIPETRRIQIEWEK